MPGTPKKKLQAVEQLEREAFGLAAGLRCIVPERCLEEPDLETADPIHLAWFVAYRAAMHAMGFMEQLGDTLRAKADITQPGPIAQLFGDEPGSAPTEAPLLEQYLDGESLVQAATPETTETITKRARDLSSRGVMVRGGRNR